MSRHGQSSWVMYIHKHVSTWTRVYMDMYVVGSGGRAVERRTVNRGDGGSIPPVTVSKPRQFRPPYICLFSEETLKPGGPFYLVSMPGEVKDPTQGVNV